MNMCMIELFVLTFQCAFDVTDGASLLGDQEYHEWASWHKGDLISPCKNHTHTSMYSTECPNVTN